MSTATGELVSDSASSTAASPSVARRDSGNKGPFTREQIQSATNEGQHGLSPARSFSLWSVIGIAYSILNSWVAMATSLSVALPSGGQSVVLWGIVISFLGNLATAASLAEICHVYPTSGGQVHWAAVLAPTHLAPLFSWTTGWFAVAGWVALTATASSLAGSLVTGMYALTHEGYEVQRYQIFIVYVGYALLACALNLWGVKLLPLVNRVSITWSMVGAVVIAIVCLACSSGDYNPPKEVFGGFINETGWVNGVSWILGLLQSSFGLTAYDAVSHMVEEMPQPHRNAPIAMVLAVVIGSVSSFIFLLVLLFSMGDVNGVLESTSGPLIGAIYQATNSVAGAACLSVFPVVSMLFAAQGILTGGSRVVYAFARDGGLPFSPFFARMNPRTGVPDNAVMFTTACVIIFGLIYLGSSSALNAILSSSVVFLNVSYSIPIALLLARGRHLLRPASFPEPTMTMGPILGPIANVVGLVFTVFTTVFFLFPPDLPVTGSNMNYAIAVFGFILIIAVIQWFAVGRHTFTGPKDLGGLLELARTEIAESPRVHDAEHGVEKTTSRRHQKEVAQEL